MTENSDGHGSIEATERTTLNRHPERGNYDRDLIYSILDEALVCHVGLVHRGSPLVLPTLHVRVGDHLYIHGAGASTLITQGGASSQICVTVTLVDGLVLARSAFHHSLNFRSVVAYGDANLVDDSAEKLRILETLVEHAVPGRTPDCRPASKAELDGTAVLGLPLSEASAKIREGAPVDAKGDMDLPHWAGVLPLHMKAGAPIVDAHTPQDTQTPDYLLNYERS